MSPARWWELQNARAFEVEPLDDMGDPFTVTLAEIAEAEDFETLRAVRDLEVGGDVVVGGGAAPSFRLRRTL